MNENICFYCKGDMKSSYNTHFSDLENCMVIIKNVPCMECVQCGEIVYTVSMVGKIEKIIEKFKAIKTEVVIMDYNN